MTPTLPASRPMRDNVRAQVVVIGSGPGGAMAALQMAEAGLDVLLLEEGSHLSLDSAPHFSREEILQKYRHAAINVTMGRAKVAWVEGCCVGGGSEINRGIYHRTPDEVLNRWRTEYRVENLTPEEMRPHFEACEEITRVSYLPGEAPAISLKLAEGARALGWAAVEAPRLVVYERDWRTNSPEWKQSMTETCVPRFTMAGGRLMADTRIDRLSRSNGHWELRAEHAPPAGPRRRFTISADVVFVACGAVQSPLLLRRSGITRNVGDTLRFHPMLKVVARFPTEVNAPSDLEPVHQVKEFDPRFSMGCSISKRPALALALVDRPELIPDVDRDWRRMAIYYVQTTGGQATVRGVPGFRDPLVRSQENPGDLGDLAEGLKRLCECLFAAGAEAIYPALPNLPILRSMDDIGALPARISPMSGGIATMHLFSSCPMGEDTSRTAADSYGKVHGMDGLYLADASLLCGPTIVNPQGSVMAVAHRNAHHYLSTAGVRSRSVSLAV